MVFIGDLEQPGVLPTNVAAIFTCLLDQVFDLFPISKSL